MHILAPQSQRIEDTEQAVDLGQDPGDIVFLTSADTEIAGFSQNAHVLTDKVSLRLANLLTLTHPYSVDLYVENTIIGSKCIILRLLGGANYWSYGLEAIVECTRKNDIPLLVLPGDDKWDENLVSNSSVSSEIVREFWRYCVEGGDENIKNALQFAVSIINKSENPPPPKPIPRAGLWWSDRTFPTLDEFKSIWLEENRPIVPIVFYRALVQGNATAPLQALCESLTKFELNPLPIFVASLKEDESKAVLSKIFAYFPPDLILNGTAFAVSNSGATHQPTPLDQPGKPVFQIVFSSSSEESWRNSNNGLGIRDLAMYVVLPEIDGRVLTRSVSFKEIGEFDQRTQTTPIQFVPMQNRIDFVAELARNWIQLGKLKNEEKKFAIILANYPNKDGRIANGVGLDTPASVISVIEEFKRIGIKLNNAPLSSNELMSSLLSGVTNNFAKFKAKSSNPRISVDSYINYFNTLPATTKSEINQRWGSVESDPFVKDDFFYLPVVKFGNLIVGIQPARGYNIDPKETYHDPDLVPPHNYLAFYFWLRFEYQANAVIHLGKHGNLEWLPGKALALSQECYPEVALGPIPNIYPFIVNDPGEGSQAKRRNSAVIIDHLTPPLARAESHGVAAELEILLDEYYLAAGVDPKRTKQIENEVFDLVKKHGFDIDVGLTNEMDRGTQLTKIDSHLCDLKELQIRDGLHIFGVSPQDNLLIELVVALARVPRGSLPCEQSIHRAIVADLEIVNFDPLDCEFSETWQREKQEILLDISKDQWRTNGDTVERIEFLAAKFVAGQKIPKDWKNTKQVMTEVKDRLIPSVIQSGAKELEAIKVAIEGGFVPPGPSGAPTRGRPDVLPTGRNFYSIDVRAVPTEIAWNLGFKSAERLIERFYLEEGEWLTSTVITAWGTSNMRTGGDDIAQAMALLGVRPVWEKGSGRVTGFEIISAAELERPRVDVTIRISGFFRDAFPHQMNLFDSAVKAIAKLDEPALTNPIAARVKLQEQEYRAAGQSKQDAFRQATFRVFGSKPGAYGAGLQALIDEGIWQDKSDFANAYLAWGSYAYGSDTAGKKSQKLMENQLQNVEAIIQNQDNREHDILDSDDYYQFEGGLSATIETLRNQAPKIYHNDHSRPERPVIRSLEEEVGRIVRGRASNPKWIAGVMRHGYKGAFEIAATVDYLFAFAATTKCVRNHHFDQLHSAYIEDEQVRTFIQEHNSDAFNEIVARFAEAIDRGLWAPRRNSTYSELMEWKNVTNIS